MELKELKDAIDQQGRAFEEFKTSNNEAMEQIKKGAGVDPVLTAKIEKANAALGELETLKARIEKAELKANRPALGADGKEINADVVAHKGAFEQYVRKGIDSGLSELESKTMSVGTNTDGGYALPIDQDKAILELLRDISPMRRVANVIQVSTSDYRKLVNTKGTASGWVGETDSRAATATSTLAQITPFMGEIYANPQATQNSLDDLFFDVEGFINGEVATEFAEQEGSAFTAGDASKKPKGFLAYTTAATADGTRAFGTLEHIVSGAAADFIAVSSSAGPGDVFIDLIQKMKAGYRQGATWMANSATVGKMRKFRDNEGNYLWQPGLVQGQPNTFVGYGITENEDMPDVAAGALAVAFGNWKRGYTIVDRIGTRTLRDPFTNKPYVGFYTTKRVGGMVADSQAIKLIKISA